MSHDVAALAEFGGEGTEWSEVEFSDEETEKSEVERSDEQTEQREKTVGVQHVTIESTREVVSRHFPELFAEPMDNKEALLREKRLARCRLQTEAGDFDASYLILTRKAFVTDGVVFGSVDDEVIMCFVNEIVYDTKMVDDAQEPHKHPKKNQVVWHKKKQVKVVRGVYVAPIYRKTAKDGQKGRYMPHNEWHWLDIEKQFFLAFPPNVGDRFTCGLTDDMESFIWMMNRTPCDGGLQFDDLGSRPSCWKPITGAVRSERPITTWKDVLIAPVSVLETKEEKTAKARQAEEYGWPMPDPPKRCLVQISGRCDNQDRVGVVLLQPSNLIYKGRVVEINVKFLRSVASETLSERRYSDISLKDKDIFKEYMQNVMAEQQQFFPLNKRSRGF